MTPSYITPSSGSLLKQDTGLWKHRWYLCGCTVLYCAVLYCTVLWYLPHTLHPSLVHLGDVDQVLGQLGGTWATHPVIEHTSHCIKA